VHVLLLAVSATFKLIMQTACYAAHSQPVWPVRKHMHVWLW
jgi:hypothetical protein